MVTNTHSERLSVTLERNQSVVVAVFVAGFRSSANLLMK